MAANVRFDEEMKVSTTMNVKSTDTIMNIARYMPHLKVIFFFVILNIILIMIISLNKRNVHEDNWFPVVF